MSPARQKTILALIVSGVFLYLVGTLPSAAHGAPAPEPKVQQQQPTKPEPKLYIYEKLLPLQPGDIIIKVPRIATPEEMPTNDPMVIDTRRIV